MCLWGWPLPLPPRLLICKVGARGPFSGLLGETVGERVFSPGLLHASFLGEAWCFWGAGVRALPRIVIHSHVWVRGGDPPGGDTLLFSFTLSDHLAAPKGAGLSQGPGSPV